MSWWDPKDLGNDGMGLSMEDLWDIEGESGDRGYEDGRDTP